MGYTAKPPNARSGWDRALPIVAVLVGLVVGVLVGYLVFDSDDGGGSSTSSSFATGTDPLELPETLGDFRDTIEVQRERAGGDEPPGFDERRENAGEVARRTADAYSEAYGGAGAGVRLYADDSLERHSTVIAVRARTPGLVIGPVQDPAYLRLAKPEREVVKIGETQCQVINGVVTQGKTPDPGQLVSTVCQRTGSKIAVFVFGTGFNGPDGAPAMSKLTDDAWNALATR